MIRMPLSLLLLPFVCGIVALLWVPFTFEVQFILDDESTHFAFYWRVFGLGISLTPMVRFVGRNTIARIHKALPRPDAVKPRELLSKLRNLAQGVRTQGRSMARTAHLFAGNCELPPPPRLGPRRPFSHRHRLWRRVGSLRPRLWRTPVQRYVSFPPGYHG